MKNFCRWLLSTILAAYCATLPSIAASPKFVKGGERLVIYYGTSELNRKATETAIQIISISVERVDLPTLVRPGERLAAESILEDLKRKVAEVALDEAKRDPKLFFELSSGKLTAKGSVNVGAVQVSLGEVNVYKIIKIFAAPIAACAAVEVLADRISCVRAALQTGRITTKAGDPSPRGMKVKREGIEE